MTIRKIVLMGNESLKGIAEPIADPTAPDVAALAQDMRETLKSIDANGLAAPQVEVPKRLVVYRVPAERIPKGAKMTFRSSKMRPKHAKMGPPSVKMGAQIGHESPTCCSKSSWKRSLMPFAGPATPT